MGQYQVLFIRWDSIRCCLSDGTVSGAVYQWNSIRCYAVNEVVLTENVVQGKAGISGEKEDNGIKYC
jgi:hypothetical protein